VNITKRYFWPVFRGGTESGLIFESISVIYEKSYVYFQGFYITSLHKNITFNKPTNRRGYLAAGIN